MRALNERGWKKFAICEGTTYLAERDRWCPLVSTSKTLYLAHGRLAPSGN